MQPVNDELDRGSEADTDQPDRDRSKENSGFSGDKARIAAPEFPESVAHEKTSRPTKPMAVPESLARTGGSTCQRHRTAWLKKTEQGECD